MTYKITYNGFGSEGDSNFKWGFIRVQQYTSRPLYAEDDQTHWTTLHSISGTALLTTDTDLKTTIENARDKLSKPSRNLVIKLGADTIVTVGNDDFDTTDGLASPYSTNGTDSSFAGNSETAGYPRCTFEINNFYGSENAMVSFTIEWVESKLDSLEDPLANFSILAHHWRQSFSIDESGLQKWTITGSLHVRPYAPAGDAEVNLGRNPDSYRGLVMPSIPSNFRVKRMDWATEQSGEKLLYTLEFQEHARRLPAPAKTGRGSFSFRRSLDSDAGLLGVKMFDAELEGDANAKTTELLASLLDASTKRIVWTGVGKDLITSIEVRETDIFSKKRIGLRVLAKGIDANAVAALQGLEVSGAGLNFGILSDFVTEDNVAEAPSVWGSALVSSYKRQLFIPYANYDKDNFPKAQLMTMTGSGTTNTTGGENSQGEYTETIYEVEDGGLSGPTQIDHDNLTGDLIGEQTKEDRDFHYLKVRGTERLGASYNIKAFSTYSQNPKQIPWQISTPEVYLESEYTLTRHDKPPPMMQFNVPKNAIVLDEQSSVDSGEIDGNGHRIFSRHVKRRIQLLWGWNSDDPVEDFVNYSWTIGGSTVNMIYRYPIIVDMHRPYDPRLDSEYKIDSNTVFTGTTPDEFYPISFSLPIGTDG